MVSMSSLDAINIDDRFDERDNTQTSYKPFHYVDENSPFKNVFVDVNYVKNCIDTLTNEELEQVIKHCNMLIERNTVEMGGVIMEIGFLGLLTLVFVVLKLMHYSDLSWLGVTVTLFVFALIVFGKTKIKSKNKSLRK
jgi:hypothetical protein